MCQKEKPTMAGLKWAIAYRFDEEADGYVLTTFDEETNQEQSQPGEPITLFRKESFSDSDLDDFDDDPSL
jgi:hypothetical protein